MAELATIARPYAEALFQVAGKGDLKRVAIDPSLMVADDREVLEDLLVAAHADAKQKVEAQMAEEMQKATAGLNLPGGLPSGLKLPF
jgi:DNA-binding protein YbaB